jgi:hypothetical protein
MPSITVLTVLSYTPKELYEQANHIQGPRTNLLFSPRLSKSLLPILNNRLELEQWINRNQEFSFRQRTNMTQR